MSNDVTTKKPKSGSFLKGAKGTVVNKALKLGPSRGTTDKPPVPKKTVTFDAETVYREDLKEAKRMLAELEKRQPLADVTLIAATVDLAETAVAKSPPEYARGSSILQRVEPLYTAQKLIADGKVQEQNAYTISLQTAKSALTQVKAPADPAPLEELIRAAEGLASKGLFVPAKARLDTHPSVLKDINKTSDLEGGKHYTDSYPPRRINCDRQYETLLDPPYKGMADLSPLTERLQAASVHEKAGRFKSAYDALDGFEKVVKKAQDAADEKLAKKQKHLELAAACTGAINEVNLGATFLLKDGKQITLAVAGELYQLKTAAGQLAEQGKFSDAIDLLKTVPELKSKALKRREKEKLAAEKYDGLLTEAKRYIAELHPPLSDPARLQKWVDVAQAFVEKSRYDAAVKKLEGCKAEYEKQKKAELKSGPEREEFLKQKTEADKLLEGLRGVALADAGPVADLIGTAAGLAAGGDFKNATKALGGVAGLVEKQELKAADESKKEEQYKQALAAATNAVDELATFGTLIDAAGLKKDLELAAGLAAGGRFASACDTLALVQSGVLALKKTGGELQLAQRGYQAKVDRAGEVMKTLGDLPEVRKELEAAVTAAANAAADKNFTAAAQDLDLAVLRAEGFVRKSGEQAKDKAAYELRTEKVRSDLADLPGSTDDANCRDAEVALKAAQAVADRGLYSDALKLVARAEASVLKAVIEQNDNAAKQKDYVNERVLAIGEYAELTKLGKTASPDRLWQLIEEANALAQAGKFVAAFNALATHTALYQELLKLQKSEGDTKKSSKYPEELKKQRDQLLKLEGKPHSDIAEMKRLVDEAEAAGKAEKFTTAMDLLRLAALEYTAETEKAEAAAKALKEEAEFKEKYETKARTSREIADQLAVSPGGEAAAKVLTDALARAANLAEESQYKNAYLVLKKAKTKGKADRTEANKQIDGVGKLSGIVTKDYGAVKDLSAKDQKAVEELGKRFKEAKKNADGKLAEYRKVAGPSVVAEYEARVLSATNRVLNANKQAVAATCLSEMTAAVDALSKVYLELTSAVGKGEESRGDCDDEIASLRVGLDWLFLNAPVAEIQPLKGLFDKAVQLASNREYEAAKEKLAGIRKRVDALRDSVDTAMKAWTAADLKLTALPGQWQAYTNDPVLKNRVEAFKEKVAAIRFNTVQVLRDYDGAVLEAEVLIEEVGRLATTKSEIVKFNDGRTAAKKEVAERETAVRVKLTELETAIAAEANEDGLKVSDLDDAIQKAMLAWLNRADSATNEADLNKELALKELTGIEEQIADRAKDVKAAVTDVKGQAEQRAFDAARVQTDRALEPIRSRGGEAAAVLLKEYADLIKAAPAGYPAAEAKMKELRTKAERLPTAVDKQQTEAAVAARKRAADALLEIDKLQKGLTQWFPTSTNLGKEFAAFFAAQKEQVADLEGVRESGNLDAIAAAEKELDTIMTRTRAAAADARNQSTGGSSFLLVVKKIEEIDKLLKTPALKKCRPETYAGQRKEFTDLSADAKTKDPGAALVALMKFQEALGPVVDGAIRAALAREQLKLSLKTAEEAVQPLKAVAPTLADALGKRIEGAKAEGAKERGEVTAKNRLDLILKEARAAADQISKDPLALAGKEKKARETKETAKNIKRTWEAALKLYEDKTLPAAATAVAKHPEGDETQIDDLRALRDKALKAAKAKDYVGATDQIKRATAVADRVVKSPQGLKTTSRDNLPAVQDRWQKAVEAVQAGLQANRDKIAELAKAETIPGLDGITKALAAAAEDLFDRNAFKAGIQTLAAKGSTQADRRAAREAAMQAVRDYREKLTHPVLVVLLVNNPFGAVPLNLIKAALDDLDLNIQRCV